VCSSTVTHQPCRGRLPPDRLDIEQLHRVHVQHGAVDPVSRQHLGRSQCPRRGDAGGDQEDRQIVQAQIDRHLLEAAPGDEARDGVDEGDEAFHCKTRRHADDMLFADPFHEGAARHLLTHPPDERRVEVGADIGDARITLGQLEDHVDAGRAHHSCSSAPYICSTRSFLMLDL
jgi:hypothetical protein